MNIEDKEKYINKLEYENDKLKEKIIFLENKNNYYKEKYYSTVNSKSWKLTLPLRYLLLLIKGIKNALTFKKLKSNDKQLLKKNFYYKLGENKLKRQRDTKLKKNLKFSIILVVNNDNIDELDKSISSILNQTYSNLQLYIVNNTNKKNIEDSLIRYIENDNRLYYKDLGQNLNNINNINKVFESLDGDFICILNQGNILHETILYEFTISIVKQNADLIYSDTAGFKDNFLYSDIPNFKPDYSPDTLRSYNYIGDFFAFDKELLKVLELKCLIKQFIDNRYYDIILRLSEKAKKIVHIPKMLYYWKYSEESIYKDINIRKYNIECAKKAIEEHLKRIDLKGYVKTSKLNSTFKIEYDIINNPLISIIICNNNDDKLLTCIRSIKEKTNYSNYEIIAINSKNNLKDKNVYELQWNDKYSFSKMINYGVNFAKGKYLIILDNNVEIISNNWIEEMIMFVQRKDVGVVGNKVYYLSNTIQSLGMTIGTYKNIGYKYNDFLKNEDGYMGELTIVQNVSALTHICLSIRKDIFVNMKGLNENFNSVLSIIDVCLRLIKQGYYNIVTPYSEIYYTGISQEMNISKKELKEFYLNHYNYLRKNDRFFNNNIDFKDEENIIKPINII